MNLEAEMLTGHDAHAAAVVADQLTIDTAITEVRPKDKATRIEELQAQGRTVAMISDDMNDNGAPALAQADVGVAIRPELTWPSRRWTWSWYGANQQE